MNITPNQKLVLAALEINLSAAKTPQMRKHVQDQIDAFKSHCAPKPKPTRPSWIDKF